MALTLKKRNSYTWPVTIIIPVDGGHKEKSTFDVEFKRLTQTRISEIRKLARKMEIGAIDDDEMLEDQEAAKEIILGCDGVVDEENKEIKFSEKRLNELLDIPTVAGQIVKAWFDSLETAKRKN